MKVLLVAAGVLLISALHATPIRKVKRENVEISQETKDGVVAVVNDVRRQLATVMNVGNMHEVSWDDDLHVPDFECGTKLPKKIEDSFTEFSKNPTEEEFEKLMNRVASQTELSCLHPLQTSIACIAMTCPDKTEFENCVCGPETTFSDADMDKGEPGSKCDGGSDNGLCEDSESSSGFSSTVTIGILTAFYLVASLL